MCDYTIKLCFESGGDSLSSARDVVFQMITCTGEICAEMLQPIRKIEDGKYSVSVRCGVLCSRLLSLSLSLCDAFRFDLKTCIANKMRINEWKYPVAQCKVGSILHDFSWLA